MKKLQVKKVMKQYGKAWETQNTELLLKCFTKNGIYQESPLVKPYKGHDQIARFWKKAVIENTKKITFRLKKCYISGDEETGFAEWECKNTHKWDHDGKWKKGHMAGIMILKMKGDKISYLNEYWNTK